MQKEQDNILTPTMFQEQLMAAMGTSLFAKIEDTATPTTPTVKIEENDDEAQSTTLGLCGVKKPDER